MLCCGVLRFGGSVQQQKQHLNLNSEHKQTFAFPNKSPQPLTCTNKSNVKPLTSSLFSTHNFISQLKSTAWFLFNVYLMRIFFSWSMKMDILMRVFLMVFKIAQQVAIEKIWIEIMKINRVILAAYLFEEMEWIPKHQMCVQRNVLMFKISTIFFILFFIRSHVPMAEFCVHRVHRQWKKKLFKIPDSFSDKISQE